MKQLALTLILIACGTLFLLWLYLDAAARFPQVYRTEGPDPAVRIVCVCFLLVYLAAYALIHRNGRGPSSRRR
jgi:hypothetical protein